MDINPLIVDESGVVAVDARIVVERVKPTTSHYAHMAIHPYPSYLVSQWQLPDGTNMTIRPIRPEDADIEQTFVRALSEESKYFRFMDTLQELTPTMLVRFTQIDYDREMAFIGVVELEGTEVEVGVCRYISNPDGESCEFALVVADAWHHQGIGLKLMATLIDVARAKGLKRMEGEVLANNRAMLGLVERLGFAVMTSPDDPGIKQVQLSLV